MDYNPTISTGDSFEDKCDNCGARFKVNVTKQTAHNDREEYNCPECGKQHSTRASMPINDRDITLISPRTDGRTDLFKK